MANYKVLPKFSSYEEAAEWLDTHSTADLKTTPVQFTLSPNFTVRVKGKNMERRLGTIHRRKAKKKSEYIVFISHSSKDAWIARVIAEKIAAAGATPWLDEKELKGGDDIGDKIKQGIIACQEAVVLVSPYSLKSQWVLHEIGAVWGREKRVTPILYGVPYRALKPFGNIKAIELNDFDEFLQQLKDRIS
jgi:hypothetical protein